MEEEKDVSEKSTTGEKGDYVIMDYKLMDNHQPPRLCLQFPFCCSDQYYNNTFNTNQKRNRPPNFHNTFHFLHHQPVWKLFSSVCIGAVSLLLLIWILKFLFTPYSASLPYCNEIYPPFYLGGLPEEPKESQLSVTDLINLARVEQNDLDEGGSRSPRTDGICTPWSLPVTVFIPFDGCWLNVLTVIRRLHSILRRQQSTYRIVVVKNKSDNDDPNTGILLDAAYLGLKNSIPSSSCLVFHPASLLPLTDLISYGCTEPRTLSSHMGPLQVISVSRSKFELVNGFSSVYSRDNGTAAFHDLMLRLENNGEYLTEEPLTAHQRLDYCPDKRQNIGSYKLETIGKSAVKDTYSTVGLNTLGKLVLQMTKDKLFTLIQIGPQGS